MNRKYYYTLLFLFVACLLLSLLYCPPVDLLIKDKLVFRYAGLVIYRGGVPYRDLFDHKPPLIFFWNALAYVFGNWGWWLMDFGLVFFTTLVFFRLCRKHRLPYPWILPLLFNLMIRDFLVHVGVGMTREYAAIFELLFFCVVIGEHRYKYFFMGLLGGLTFFMQQDQSLTLVPFLIYALLQWETIPVGQRIIRMGGGFLAIALPLFLYFALNHALSDAWNDAFLFNTQWYTAQKKTLGDHFRTIKKALDDVNYELPFMVAVTLGISSLFLRTKSRGLLIAAICGVGLSMSAEFMGGRMTHGFEQYFLPLSSSLPILLFVIFAFTEEEWLRVPTLRLALGVLLCSSLSYTALQHATHLTPSEEDPEVPRVELEYLRQHRPGDYQLYFFNTDPYVYDRNDWRALSPSKWIYQHFWTWWPAWDPDQRILQSIASDLLRHHTTYIVMNFSEFDQFVNPANHAWWLNFLHTHYESVPLPGADSLTSIWKLKEPAEKIN